jgi:deazaflavin-dependent oxidoreductase (nitroreductase family)
MQHHVLTRKSKILSTKSESQFLYLNTSGWKTGRQHKIEIWFAVYNGRYYIISEHGNNAHWVQNILHNSKVSFSVNNKIFKGAARIINRAKESELAAEVSKLMNTKYGWSEGVIVELMTN